MMHSSPQMMLSSPQMMHSSPQMTLSSPQMMLSSPQMMHSRLRARVKTSSQVLTTASAQKKRWLRMTRLLNAGAKTKQNLLP